MNFDSKAMEAISTHPKAIVFWILTASYSYYIRDYPILSDYYFDHLCASLKGRDLSSHPWNWYFDNDALAAGSLFHIKQEQYPRYVVQEAERMIREININVNQHIIIEGE